MAIIALVALVFLVVMLVTHTQATLVVCGTLIALSITAGLVRRKLAPQESRTPAAGRDDEWWKGDWPGKS